jgi:hypothetical protein
MERHRLRARGSREMAHRATRPLLYIGPRVPHFPAIIGIGVRREQPWKSLYLASGPIALRRFEIVKTLRSTFSPEQGAAGSIARIRRSWPYGCSANRLRYKSQRRCRSARRVVTRQRRPSEVTYNARNQVALREHRLFPTTLPLARARGSLTVCADQKVSRSEARGMSRGCAGTRSTK